MDSSLTFPVVMKGANAWLPLAMSLAALMVVVAHVARYGPAREADEGTTAHLWQLLMLGQLPVIAYFGVTQLRRAPRSAVAVLALQIGAMLAALAPVYFLRW